MGSRDNPDNLLAQFREPASSQRTGLCPDRSVWYSLAGLNPDSQMPPGMAPRSELLYHAASCGCCAERLREAIEDLEGPASDAEESFFREHPLQVSAAWIADRRGGKTAGWRALPQAWRLAIAASLTVAVGTGLYFWCLPRLAFAVASASLARAETVGRAIDYRFSEAPFGPLSINRSGASGGRMRAELDLPASWAAWAGDSPKATALRARLTAEAGPIAALASSEALLKDAVRRAPEQAELWNDLGAIHAAEATGQPDSRFAAEALEDFDRALYLRSDFAPALYNRALLLNVLRRREEACRTLARFTEIETDRGWRSESASRVSCPAAK